MNIQRNLIQPQPQPGMMTMTEPELEQEATMKMTMEHLGDLIVWRCAGKLVHGSDTSLLVDAVTAQPARSVVVDLAEISAVDAAGLGALVALRNWSCAAGVEFTISNPSAPVRTLLTVTNLDAVLPVAECSAPAAAFAVIHAA
jgi:anti-anti-sigma factor